MPLSSINDGNGPIPAIRGKARFLKLSVTVLQSRVDPTRPIHVIFIRRRAGFIFRKGFCMDKENSLPPLIPVTKSDSFPRMPPINPALDHAELKLEGNKFFSQNKFVEAIHFYNEAIKKAAQDPASAVYYANRCACLQKLGLFQNALIDARLAVSIDPEYCNGRVRFASCLQELKHYERAREEWEKVLVIDPAKQIAKDNLRECKKLMTKSIPYKEKEEKEEEEEKEEKEEKEQKNEVIDLKSKEIYTEKAVDAEYEIASLKRRIQVLEDELRKNKIPIPL